MLRTARLIATLIVIGLFSVACSGDRPIVSDGDADVAPTMPAETAGPSGVERYAQELDAAVEHLLVAGSYRFESEVSLVVGEDRSELRVTGWVDGEDRELTLHSGEAFVTTRVVNGVATVERDGTTTEVPLEAAASVPSLEVLTQIRDVDYAPGGTLRGSLSANALAEFGFGVNGSAQVTVILDQGQLTQYRITATDGAWSISSGFRDIGAVTHWP